MVVDVNSKRLIAVVSFICGLIAFSPIMARADNGLVSVKLRLEKPANLCVEGDEHLYCQSDRLIDARVLVRRLFSPKVEKYRSNSAGIIRANLKPGYYEMALTHQYSYSRFQESFGIPVGPHGCYPTTPTFRNQTPTGYVIAGEQDKFNLWNGKEEAHVYFLVGRKSRTIRILYSERCE